MLKVNKNTRNTRGTSRRISGVFIVNFEHILHLFLVFLLLTLSKEILAEIVLTFYTP